MMLLHFTFKMFCFNVIHVYISLILEWIEGSGTIIYSLKLVTLRSMMHKGLSNWLCLFVSQSACHAKKIRIDTLEYFKHLLNSSVS